MVTKPFVKQKPIRPRFSPEEFDFLIHCLGIVKAYSDDLWKELKRVETMIRVKERRLRNKGAVWDWCLELESYRRLRKKVNRRRLSSRYTDMEVMWGIQGMLTRLEALKEGRYTHRDGCLYDNIQALYKSIEP